MQSMEFDQIFKRLDWLDEEHRKDKAEVEGLAEKLAYTNGELKVANIKIKELTTELSKFTTVLPRIDQFNEALTNQRVEILKYVDEMDNKDVDKLPQAEKRFQVQIDTINKSITEIRKIR
jgi:DNA repair ATPase RecN